MIFVDSSVWIDFFRGASTRETRRLETLALVNTVITGDLVMAEVLQGFREERDFARALAALQALQPSAIGGVEIAVRAARNFRSLRRSGVTVRKTIDCLIATRCIAEGFALLYRDRDFDPFVEHLGLVSAMAAWV